VTKHISSNTLLFENKKKLQIIFFGVPKTAQFCSKKKKNHKSKTSLWTTSMATALQNN